jgi:adenosylmethionine-8-amino-7-oxononanoate aminotransferase
VRGSHLMACVEYVLDKKTKEPIPADWDIGQRIINETMPRGLLARPMGHLTVMSPPLIITRAQIDEMVEILREATLAVMDQLTREGLWRG